MKENILSVSIIYEKKDGENVIQVKLPSGGKQNKNQQ